jgi:CRP-like cAMP-binding protein
VQERIEVTRKPALDLGKDHLDVNAFIGRRPKNLRGSRKVDVVKAAQQPPERSGFPIARSIPKALHASDKALSACFSLVFKQLTTEHRDNLMQSSYRVSPRSGDELILEGSDINWLFVVVSGVYQVFSTVLGKEMLLGSISGSGQVLGERDFLLRQHAQALLRQDGKALRHSVTVVADDDCSVVAVPVALLEQCLAETSFEEDLEALLDARATIHQIISRGPACAGKAPIASLLTSTELQFVVDCAGIVMYDEGETLHDRPELTECVTAIIIEGELEMERHHTARGDQEVPALALGHDKHQGKHQGKMIMLPGDDLYEVVKACKMIRSGTLVDSYKVVAVEMTKILYVRMEDIAPILTTNYALRKLIQDGGRDVVLQAQYHFYFFPWMRNLEWRVFNLGISRRVGQESWNDVEDAELQVYWNRIAEHLPQDDWLPMLSDHDVIVTFFTKEEAVKVVQELDKSWAARFASVRIAGAEGGYGALVRRVTTRIRECGALEPDLRDIYEDLVAMVNSIACIPLTQYSTFANLI